MPEPIYAWPFNPLFAFRVMSSRCHRSVVDGGYSGHFYPITCVFDVRVLSAIYCRVMNMKKICFMLISILAFSVISIIGCGSNDSQTLDDDLASSQIEEDPVQIINPSGVFTVDDVVTAGWKKSKELSPETLPGATSVWYGFYNQRDVEVRIYETHADALGSGMGPADDATGRGKPAPFAVGGISATRMSYTTYAVVGNLILLCEIKIEDCQNLLDAIK